MIIKYPILLPKRTFTNISVAIHIVKYTFLIPAIKTGRYTHEKKARDIEEVKKIKIEQSTVSTFVSRGSLLFRFSWPIPVSFKFMLLALCILVLELLTL